MKDMFLFPRCIHLFLICSFFYTLHDLVQADPPYQICSNSTASAENTIFRYNLDNLLFSLSSNASISKFYNTTFGDDNERLYGLSLCYEYVAKDQCAKCIELASQDIQKNCPIDKEAVVWEEICQLRYSNKSFFGHLDITGNIWKYNTENVSETEQYYFPLVKKLLRNITKQAAFYPATGMYVTGEVNITETENIYAYVQCTSDLSPDDCNTCLERAIEDTSSCCSQSRGVRLLSRSCYLRYEFYPFYKGATGTNSSQYHKKITKSTKKDNWLIVSLPTGSAILMVAIVATCIYCLVMKRKNRQSTNAGEHRISAREIHNLQAMENLNSHILPLATLSAATDNFSESNKLGEGGFGPVYKGRLPGGKEVAIKRLLSGSDQGADEFTNEVLFILQLQHKNLVKLLGFCVDGEEKLLIYEYMPNGSLDTFLFDPTKRAQLNWSIRVSIISGIARGVLYLHEDSRLRIIHRDIKASNILLDSEMTPKISDFGMARIFGGSHDKASTRIIVGTYGYMAPEYAMEGIYSIKSDVFSFGVLLFELITGKKNAGFHLSKLAPNLLAYAWQLWKEGRGLELIDPLLKDSCDLDEFLRYVHIGLLCVQEDACDRPNMSTVMVMLKREVVALKEPEKPAFCVARFADHYGITDISCSNDLTIALR